MAQTSFFAAKFVWSTLSIPVQHAQLMLTVVPSTSTVLEVKGCLIKTVVVMYFSAEWYDNGVNQRRATVPYDVVGVCTNG